MSTGQIRMEFDTTASSGPVGPVGAGRSLNGEHEPSARIGLTREDVMTASEVGVLLRLASSSVYDVARRGAIPGHRVGRAWRFIRQEIEEWLRAR